MVRMASIFLYILLSVVSCSILDDKLSIDKEYNDSDKLRLNGYYYFKYGEDENTRLVIYFFYKNGVLFHAGAPLATEVEENENSLKDSSFYGGTMKSKARWGIYNISGDTIAFERWYPSTGSLPAYVRSGKILNDTTFVITESYRMRFGRKWEYDQEYRVYHFREFKHKPDSTNPFIDSLITD